jgi:hypothetical protein
MKELKAERNKVERYLMRLIGINGNLHQSVSFYRSRLCGSLSIAHDFQREEQQMT